MAKAKPQDKHKPHVPNRRIKWRGGNPPLRFGPGETNEDGKLIAVTMSHLTDAEYLLVTKQRIVRLATKDELENAVVYGEIDNGSNSE